MNQSGEIIQNKPNDEHLKMAYAFDEWSSEMPSAFEADLLKRTF
jgi:hypothetical protein